MRRDGRRALSTEVGCTPCTLKPHQLRETHSIADRWSGAGVTFYNCCGPTETTIINTMHKHTAGTTLTIGKPTPNNNVYILDGNMSPCQIGDVGTMWAGGAGVTRGYIGQPDRTAERYHYDKFVDDGYVRFYHSSFPPSLEQAILSLSYYGGCVLVAPSRTGEQNMVGRNDR
jgi:acyl-CoA synthetase (AMP-forming)/AMP-acid ligase II